MSKLNIKEFKEKRLWKYWQSIDIDWAFWGQCVDLAKLWLRDQFWIPSIYFYGNAKNAFQKNFLHWQKNWDYFFKKTNYKKWLKPNIWDLIFWEYWTMWHVAIVLESYNDWIIILEANTGNGNWYWADDRVIENRRSYNKCLWWYAMNYKWEDEQIDYKMKYMELKEEYELLKEEKERLEYNYRMEDRLLESIYKLIDDFYNQ